MNYSRNEIAMINLPIISYSIQYYFNQMGSTNIQSINNKGNPTQILPNNSFRKHAEGQIKQEKRKVIIANMSTKKYEEWVYSLKKLQRYNEFLQLPLSYAWKVDCLCSDYGCLQLQYQDCIYTLNDEIGYRQETKQYFKQYQIWYILFLIITIQYNISSQVPHYSCWNIHPASIVINQQGFVKLLFTLTRPDQDHCSNHFIPPEDIPYLLMQLVKSTDQRVMMRINKQISQTFQLGLTLLSAANLKNYQFLYKYSPVLNLNINKLNEQLDLWIQRSYDSYTLTFKSLVANLCSFNPAQRLSGPQLWEWVSEHGEDIKKKLPFEFKYLPKKLSALVENNVKNSQKRLLSNSRIKLEKLSRSQIDLRKSKSPEKMGSHQTYLYQPIHSLNPKNYPPRIPKYHSSKN